MAARSWGWMVVSGVAACIPAPVLRVRDGGADAAVQDTALADVGSDDARAADVGMDLGVSDVTMAPVDVVDGGALAMLDAGDVTDAAASDACTGVVNDGGACEAATRPRLLSPLSGAISGSHRPLLRWVRSNTGRPQTLRLCADRACTRVLQTRELAADRTALPLEVDLPTGPVFWRVETTDVRGAALASATWEFFVSGRATRSVFWYGVPDFDGDGVGDLVVGAWGNASGLGRAYGYPRGRVESGMPAWTLRGGESLMGGFGFWVQSVGDINGDGFVDLGVSGFREAEGRGSVRLFLGSASGLQEGAATVLEGATAGVNFGIPVAGIGDVNGDGYADMAVGLTGESSSRGAARVYWGGPDGVSMVRSALIQGISTGPSLFGGSITPVGDLNGDGFDEFIVGAPGAEGESGAAWVFHGGRDPDWATQRTRLRTTLVGQFGAEASTLGDLEGDGYLDFVVSAPSANMTQGRVAIYSSGSGTLDPGIVVELIPTAAVASRFGTAVHGGHDVNGDESPDLVVGAPRDSMGGGQVAVYLGGTRNLREPSSLITRVGEERASFGVVVSILGDTNGDGFADIAIGSPRDNQRRPAVFVYGGSRTATFAGSPAVVMNPDPADVVFGESIAR